MKPFRIILILLSFLAQLSVFAQMKKDSLLSILPATQGIERVDMLNKLSRNLLTADPDQSKELLNESRLLATSINYKKGEIRSLSTLANYYSLQKRPFETDSLIKVADELLSKIDDKEEQLFLKFVSGIHYARTGRYSDAVEIHIEVANYAEKLSDFDLQVSALNNVGFSLQNINQLDEAKKYFLKSLDIASAHKLEFRTGEIQLNLGVLEYLKNNLGASIEHNKKAYDILKNIDVSLAARALNNLGFAHNKLGNEGKALNYYDQSLNLRASVGDIEGSAKVYQNQAKIIYKSNPKKAIELVQKSLAIAQELNSFELIRDANHFLFAHYEDAKNIDKAFEAFKMYQRSKDSIRLRSNANKVSQILSQHKIVELQKSNSITNLQLKNRNLQMGMIALSLLLVVVIFITYRFKKNKSLAINKDQLANSENAQKLQALEFENERIKLSAKIEQFKNTVNNQNLKDIIESTKSAILEDRDWVAFLIYFEKLYPKFYNRLKQEKPIDLTINEQRLIALIKINLTNKEISSILSISPTSVVKAKTRLRVKFEFDSIDTFQIFIRAF